MSTTDFLARFEERRKARAEADRTFPLMGETLRFRATVAPEVMFRFRESQRTIFQHLDELSRWNSDLEKASKANGKSDAKIAELMERIPEPSLTDDELLLIADETVLACLEPESHEAWARLRSPDLEQPITYQEIFDLVGYLLGRVTDLPTVAPTASPDGRTETAKPSKAASSSRAKTRTASP